MNRWTYIVLNHPSVCQQHPFYQWYLNQHHQILFAKYGKFESIKVWSIWEEKSGRKNFCEETWSSSSNWDTQWQQNKCLHTILSNISWTNTVNSCDLSFTLSLLPFPISWRKSPRLLLFMLLPVLIVEFCCLVCFWGIFFLAAGCETVRFMSLVLYRYALGGVEHDLLG